MNPNKALWEKGDFTRIASTMRESGDELVATFLRGPIRATSAAAEIKVALIDIMGTITAMVEELLPRDMQVWAEGLAAEFEASFHTTRASLTTQELNLLQAARA